MGAQAWEKKISKHKSNVAGQVHPNQDVGTPHKKKPSGRESNLQKGIDAKGQKLGLKNIGEEKKHFRNGVLRFVRPLQSRLARKEASGPRGKDWQPVSAWSQDTGKEWLQRQARRRKKKTKREKLFKNAKKGAGKRKKIGKPRTEAAKGAGGNSITEYPKGG